MTMPKKAQAKYGTNFWQWYGLFHKWRWHQKQLKEQVSFYS